MSAKHTPGRELSVLQEAEFVQAVLDAHTLNLWVPSIFWDDHSDRCPCDDPETEMATELRRSGCRVLISAAPRQLACLRSDAEFYADKWGPDETPPSIKRSARATLAAIAKATGSE